MNRHMMGFSLPHHGSPIGTRRGPVPPSGLLPFLASTKPFGGTVTLIGNRGRPAISLELRHLIRRMWQANPTWGSPRIVAELQKLGIDIAKSTVEKYRPKLHKPTSASWCMFLKQHMRDTVAIDFFTVPTA